MSASVVSPLSYQNGSLYMEDVCLAELAQRSGTPAYVYSASFIREQIENLNEAFSQTPHRIHYAVKANSNLSILALCASMGTGFDIVSGGELSRVLAVGADPQSVIFSGVGKSTEEIDFCLKVGIGCFNVESLAELHRIAERATNLNVMAPISVRVNPNVDAQTHPYISTGLAQNKFGVNADQALDLYEYAASHTNLEVHGLDCHIGSQINSIDPLLESLASMLALTDELAARDIPITHIDLGGGMGVTYDDETPLDIYAYGASVQQMLGKRKQTIYLEPGRSIVANAGVLLTRVEYLKPATSNTQNNDAPNFAVVDAAMNDLIRPALYQAWHGAYNVAENSDDATAAESQSRETLTWDIVGPVCETGDFLAKSRQMQIDQGDLIAITSAGAYGMVQASNYNSRGRPCEVLVDGDNFREIRRRENIEDQIRLERAYVQKNDAP